MGDKNFGHINQSELAWRKGSRSSGSGSDCAVRDSKDPSGPILFFTPSERAAFVAGVREEHLL
ncbi:DUF397 domain-containing protein [Actinoplanes awajinensis]|uniref:DUF397 domain-containing protein n=1 Tax=Actinoplanes awajinensis subsp. mycoplanecinus TaxID=135947 RepID=A0A0X3UU77_9ACTN|nr:DUF397 domain-containing protein [Actinoplanes awajinensis]KUL35697.1 hypothetical protein ADL15_14385 [Actinoplanes awajinensis subsp. mycoplanecinus]